MRRDIRIAYRDWLVAQTGLPGRGRERHLAIMHETPFQVLVERDKDRAWYGKNLRKVWFFDSGYGALMKFDEEDYGRLMEKECSLLEMLWALSKSISEQTESTGPYNQIGWFWHMVGNLKIRPSMGDKTLRHRLQQFVGREYDANGDGSIFPLHNPPENYQNIDIWYQMMLYLGENDY